jgi:hypothetical protein
LVRWPAENKSSLFDSPYHVITINRRKQVVTQSHIPTSRKELLSDFKSYSLALVQKIFTRQTDPIRLVRDPRSQIS